MRFASIFVTNLDTFKHRDKNRRRDRESKEINKEEIYCIVTALRWTEGIKEDVSGVRGNKWPCEAR